MMELDTIRQTGTLKLQEFEEKVERKRKMESDEDKYDDYDNMSDSPCESVPSTSETPSKRTQLENGCDALNVIKKAVVVLNRLPDYKISALRPPTPQQFYSEDESQSSSDSDMQFEPEDDSSDSDFSLTTSRKKAAKSNNSNSNYDNTPIIDSSAFAYCTHETTKVRPNLPEKEITLDMIVLARKRCMRWLRGKIIQLVTKEDGRLKYKVGFEDKGKSLVSGHHIAFDSTPTLEQLYVGARVVVGSVDNQSFRPGILAELPSRKNRLRFLVFLDDHTPMYVGLPLLHLVCRPLPDSVDDLPDGSHRFFMTQYIKDWPYPHLTQYKPGQSLTVELEGVQQKCDVQLLDSSLIQVVFQENQHTEWIHRGSIRLPHMARFLALRSQQDSDDSE
ncbi:histone-lysine N-methyltransferase SETDB1-B-like [Aulostomus maculatus]